MALSHGREKKEGAAAEMYLSNLNIFALAYDSFGKDFVCAPVAFCVKPLWNSIFGDFNAIGKV